MHSEKIDGGVNRDIKYGRMLRRTGQILLFAGPLGVAVLLGLLSIAFPSLEDDPGLISLLLIFVIAPLGFFLSIFLAFKIMYLGKQYEARAKAAAYTVDTRQPVVYLRPFMADEAVNRLFRSMLFRTGVWPWFFTVEEQLADAVEPIGPLVAIGRPSEQLPTPGAVRQYFDDAKWQDVVRKWLAKARLIILQPGMSEGLWWELEKAAGTGNTERFLLLVLNMKKADYLSFSRRLTDLLGIKLPNFNEVSRWRRVSGFFEFNADWQALFLPLKAPVMRTEPYMAHKAAFNYALQTTFAKLGVPWRPYPLSRLKIFVLVICVLGLIIGTAGYLTSLP